MNKTPAELKDFLAPAENPGDGEIGVIIEHFGRLGIDLQGSPDHIFRRIHVVFGERKNGIFGFARFGLGDQLQDAGDILFHLVEVNIFKHDVDLALADFGVRGGTVGDGAHEIHIITYRVLTAGGILHTLGRDHAELFIRAGPLHFSVFFNLADVVAHKGAGLHLAR